MMPNNMYEFVSKCVLAEAENTSIDDRYWGQSETDPGYNPCEDDIPARVPEVAAHGVYAKPNKFKSMMFDSVVTSTAAGREECAAQVATRRRGGQHPRSAATSAGNLNDARLPTPSARNTGPHARQSSLQANHANGVEAPPRPVGGPHTTGASRTAGSRPQHRMFTLDHLEAGTESKVRGAQRATSTPC